MNRRNTKLLIKRCYHTGHHKCRIYKDCSKIVTDKQLLSVVFKIHKLAFDALGNIKNWRSSHYSVMQVRNKNSNIQGRPPNVVKVIFHLIRNCSKRKEFALSGSKFFPLREVPTLKRDAIRETLLGPVISF